MVSSPLFGKQDFLPESEHPVFASYSHEDSEIVGSLVVVLRAAGSGVFRDVDSIPPGSRWRAVIADAITQCHVFLLFWCRHSARSRAVASECQQAVAFQKRIVPILLDSTPLPSHLAEYQWVDIRTAVGAHEDECVEVENSIPNILPGRSSEPIRFTRLVVSQPNQAQLVAGGLQVWIELGRILVSSEEC